MSETTTPEPMTVPAWALPALHARHAKLVKIAARLGVEAPTLTVVSEPVRGFTPYAFLTQVEAERVEVMGGDVWPMTMLVDVLATGPSPRLPGGWHVLATVEHDPAGNLVGCSPAGQEQGLAALLLDAAPTCDHCNHDRSRLRTILLADENGAQVRVGSTCLRSFLGFHGDSLDALWTLIRGLDTNLSDDERIAGSRDYGTPVLDVVAAAVASVRVDGFVSTSVEYGTSTRDKVSGFLFARRQDEREANIPGGVTGQDVLDAEAALAWLATTDEQSDYMVNLRTLAAREVVQPKRFGLLASLPTAHARHLGRIAEKAARAELPPAGPVPTGRAILTGTVISTDSKHTDYGTRYVMTVLLDNGSKVWGSEPTGVAINRGDRITFTATVEAKDGDPTFGFFKRPTKATVTPQEVTTTA